MAILESLIGPVNIIMTVGIYSLIIQDNLLYRWAEYTMYAILVAYGLIQGIESIIKLGWIPIIGGNIGRVIFLILGLLVLLRFSSAWAALGRIPMAFIVGVGATLYISGETEKLIAHTVGTMLVPNNINNIVVILFSMGSLMYFTFTSRIAQPTPIKWLRIVGLYAMMIFFGVSWGQLIPYRTNLAIGRVLEILEYLGLV
jgi:hypothetical protein